MGEKGRVVDKLLLFADQPETCDDKIFLKNNLFCLIFF
jgi:hypothetical protein